MKIGINLIQYTDVQGIEVFANNLLASLVKLDSSDEFVLFTNQESSNIFNIKANNVKIVVKNFKKLNQWSLIAYQQFGLLKTLKKEKIDLLYCPSVAIPIFYKKKIVTIHDCAALRFKDESSFFSRIYLKLVFWSAKYFSLKIVTISDFAKREIFDLLNISLDKIEVISEGTPFLIDIEEKVAETALAKLKLTGQKYFFYIGNLRPRKNIARLLEAWTDFNTKHPGYSLVIAGKGDLKISEDNNARLLGVVSESEKLALYKNSLALVFPSLYEGFGLPVLEAQKLGIPVITSNISSLPEVAGTGAILIDPYDFRSITYGLEKIIDPSFLKADLIKNGYSNLDRFSWDKAALSLLAVINSFKQK